MIFDWTLSLGNIFTVIGFCISGVAFVIMMRSDLKLIGHRIGRVENDVDNIETVLHSLSESMRTMSATQAMALEMDKRIDAISRRLDNFISKAVTVNQ